MPDIIFVKHTLTRKQLSEESGAQSIKRCGKSLL